MSHEQRARHPSFHYPSPLPTVNGLLARIGEWCGNHFALATFIILGTAYIAGIMTGLTL